MVLLTWKAKYYSRFKGLDDTGVHDFMSQFVDFGPVRDSVGIGHHKDAKGLPEDIKLAFCEWLLGQSILVSG